MFCYSILPNSWKVSYTEKATSYLQKWLPVQILNRTLSEIVAAMLDIHFTGTHLKKQQS